MGRLDRDAQRNTRIGQSGVEDGSAVGARRGDDEIERHHLGDRQRIVRTDVRIRRENHENLLVRQFMGSQVFYGDGEVGEAQFRLSVPDHLRHRGRVLRVFDADDDRRVGLPEGPDQIGEWMYGQGRLRHDVEASRRQVGHHLHGGTGRGEVPEHLLGRPEQCFARRCELDAAAEPMEQLCADLALDGFDGVRQRRLRHVEGCGGAGEAAVCRHREEVLQLSAVHRVLPGAYPGGTR